MMKEEQITSSSKALSPLKPWYIRGGMHVNEVGMGLNVLIPAIFLAFTSTTSLPAKIFAFLYFLQVALAYAVHNMRTTFCVVAVPCYMTTLLVIPATLSMDTIIPAPVLLILLSLLIARKRVAICMSVCLHRYAAHAAFKCSRTTQLFLNLLGCLSHQGGPIWWAASHRCHHKHCDTKRDPHSAVQVGVERAFAFFLTQSTVEEEFAPSHNDTLYLRLLDTWSFLVCTMEMMAAYWVFGREGLFVSYTSMWICQTITLWFNIVNHPPNALNNKDATTPSSSMTANCYAANYRTKHTGSYPAFLLLDTIYPYFAEFVGESSHLDHHNNAMLAKRGSNDYAYYLFIKPLETCGLVWNVKLKDC